MYVLRIFWFLLKFFLGYAVFDSHPPVKSKVTGVYWNIPTFQCAPHQINFTALTEKYGIIQNEGDSFQGDEIAILYTPGDFPIITKDVKKYIIRNGGVPQAGNITKHLEAFQRSVEQLIPSKEFSGIGIIDFENWRPIYRQNFGTLAVYQNVSMDLERQAHPSWPDSWLEKEATEKFEKYAKKFFEETLIAATRLRPEARWGYYAYPYCFNMSPENMRRTCPKEAIQENDRQKWLFQLTDNLHPSLYLRNLTLNVTNKVQLIEGRLDEAQRIKTSLKKNSTAIAPYFWYKYQDTHAFLSKEDLFNSFTVIASYNVDTLIIWGSSNDVNSKDKCLQLYKYIDEVLGPLVINIFK